MALRCLKLCSGTGVLQEPSETMNVTLHDDSLDMSAVFELVLSGARFYGL